MRWGVGERFFFCRNFFFLFSFKSKRNWNKPQRHSDSRYMFFTHKSAKPPSYHRWWKNKQLAKKKIPFHQFWMFQVSEACLIFFLFFYFMLISQLFLLQKKKKNLFFVLYKTKYKFALIFLQLFKVETSILVVFNFKRIFD